jgi:Tfp pilus assembly protein FimT
VILIIGLIAFIATPRFNNHVRAVKLEAAARQLAAHVNFIRRTAINEGRTTTLICDPAGYRSSNVDFPDRLGTLIFVRIKSLDSSFVLTANFNSQSQLSFDFEGVPRTGATAMTTGSISLTSGDDEFIVSIAAGTGRVTVTRPVDDANVDVNDSYNVIDSNNVTDSYNVVDGVSGASI